MARRLCALADATSAGRLVALLEGGYDLDGLAGGMTSVLTALTTPAVPGRTVAPLPDNPVVRAAIEGTRAAHASAGHPIPSAVGASS
jgi:acetoin utilization deacetylase AcuC-like enzyme